jgi:uncharacterized membrane protein
MPRTETGRLAVLDLARGVAIVAMAIYHFSWDLSWFAFVGWDVGGAPGWRTFAVSIAASFLILVGVSLDLAHHKEIRWRSFWKRFALIAASAACVSIGTHFAFGDSFVRFGILHCIAVSSLIALPFTRLPLLYALVGSAIILTLPNWASSSVFDGEMWLWTGLGTPAMPSVDYVPLAPWTGATLLGVALSKAIRRSAAHGTPQADGIQRSSRPGAQMDGPPFPADLSSASTASLWFGLECDAARTKHGPDQPQLSDQLRAKLHDKHRERSTLCCRMPLHA